MKKASDSIKRYMNENGAVVSTVSRKVFESDGLCFKDIDGTGKLSAVNDWRRSPAERAAAYVKMLCADEKIPQLFVSDWRMAKYPQSSLTPAESSSEMRKTDESGLLDEEEIRTKTIFGEQYIPGTTTLIKEWFNRHLILRTNPQPDELADWINELQYTAEKCEHFIPVEVLSNSRNENGEAVFGMNDSVGVFASWPGTLGIAAAYRGTKDTDMLDRFADCIRREWDSVGMKKGYMYMADVVSDPRWQRTYGTFGEDPGMTQEIFSRLIPGIQGSEDGVTADGVAMTVKHFPGGGARDNGFDPHYKAGQWNVYSTPDSLFKYHIPTFYPAIKYGASSIMPYYSKPSAERSGAQRADGTGKEIRLEPYGFAYNRIFIDDILRKQLGFKGYINSDTGIIHNMCWGAEKLDKPERIGFAVTHSGVDIISGLFDNEYGREAYERGRNGYYDTHTLPEGISPEDVVLTDESLDRAVTRTFTELFALGLFDNPYRDPAEAVKVVNDPADRLEAMEVHRRSVVLLKKSLPLERNTRVYASVFCKNEEKAASATESLRKEISAYCRLVETPEEAQAAVIFVNPSSGEYFNATPGYLELDICEGKTVCDVGEDGKPGDTYHKETTLMGLGEIKRIADTVHSHGGRVLININFTLAWEPRNIEPLADMLTAGFDTFTSAVLDVMFGFFTPVGKLPLTLPRGDEVIAVDKDGRCVSPNDVPGYDKDKYMPDELKDENGKAYAYRDSCGNYYELGFGLSF